MQIGDRISCKRMTNSADMSNGEIIKINYNLPYKVLYGSMPEIESIQCRFFTEKHTWDTEEQTWRSGYFIRTIHNLKRVTAHE